LNELVLMGNEAELLGRVLAEAKAKFYEGPDMNLDDSQALDALISSFRTVETKEQDRRSPIRALS